MARIDLPREKKVKHLTLIREPQTITPEQFNALGFEERLEMVRVSDSAFRYRLLIEANDGPEIMARLSGQDVFLMLKEVGAEAAELLPMISPVQFTFCLDLDCWEGDRLDSGKALQWLEQLLDCEEDKVLQVAREMNFELLVLILKKHVAVLHGPEDIDDEDVRIEAMRRDGGYEFSFRNENEAKLFGYFFEVLFRHDQDFYSYLIEASRGELDALIEESVYQQRSHRLLDAGFPDPHEAKAVYGWLDPDTFAATEKKVDMAPSDPTVAQPAFMLIEANPRDLLASALAGNMTPSSNWELACLANKVLLADGIDLADKAAVQETLSRMYDTFNLALEYLCDSREDAVGLLDRAYYQYLFQVGHSLKVRLQRRARSLLEAATGPFFDLPFRTFLEALADQAGPRYHPGLDHPEESRSRPFRSAIDLFQAEKWLTRIEAQQRLFVERMSFDLPTEESFDLAGCYPEKVADLTLSQLFLTALANRLLGRDFYPDPLPVEELPGLHGSLCQGRHLDEQLCEETRDWVDGLVDGAGHFARWCLDVWELEFCTIDPDYIDPRFVGGLIVRVE